jgi:hypothetical protein
MKMQASLALSTLGDVTLIEMILIANAIWASIFMPQMPFWQAILCRKCHSGKHIRVANAIQASIFMPQNSQQFQQQTSLM